MSAKPCFHFVLQTTLSDKSKSISAHADLILHGSRWAPVSAVLQFMYRFRHRRSDNKRSDKKR